MRGLLDVSKQSKRRLALPIDARDLWHLGAHALGTTDAATSPVVGDVSGGDVDCVW